MQLFHIRLQQKLLVGVLTYNKAVWFYVLSCLPRGLLEVCIFNQTSVIQCVASGIFSEAYRAFDVTEIMDLVKNFSSVL